MCIAVIEVARAKSGKSSKSPIIGVSSYDSLDDFYNDSEGEEVSQGEEDD